MTTKQKFGVALMALMMIEAHSLVMWSVVLDNDHHEAAIDSAIKYYSLAVCSYKCGKNDSMHIYASIREYWADSADKDRSHTLIQMDTADRRLSDEERKKCNCK